MSIFICKNRLCTEYRELTFFLLQLFFCIQACVREQKSYLIILLLSAKSLPMCIPSTAVGGC